MEMMKHTKMKNKIKHKSSIGILKKMNNFHYSKGIKKMEL